MFSPRIEPGQKCKRKTTGKIVLTRFAQAEGNRIVAWLCHDENGYPVLVPVGDLEPMPRPEHVEV